MKSFSLASVVAAVLAAGLVAAGAQSNHDANRDGHSAQSAPSAQGTIQSRKRSTTGAGSEQDRSADNPDQSSERDNRAHQQSGSKQKQSEQPMASGGTKASKRAFRHRKINETKSAADRTSRESNRQAGNRGERHQRFGRNRHENNRAAERSKSLSRESRREQRSHDERNRRVERSRHETTGEAFGASERNGDAESEHGSRHDHTKLSEHQRNRLSSRLSERVDRMDIRPIPRTRISVSVGRRVPRSIRLYNLPPDVVRIYPRFRGDRFVLVKDEIVVVDPDTRHIVAVLPRSQSRHAARETTGVARSDERLELTPEQRRVIRTTVIEQPTCHYEQRLDFFLFMPVPHTIQVCEFPRHLVQEVPEIERYRYVVHSDEVVVVDPNRDRVVQVIK